MIGENWVKMVLVERLQLYKRQVEFFWIDFQKIFGLIQHLKEFLLYLELINTRELMY
jgi:hypothetical protein